MKVSLPGVRAGGGQVHKTPKMLMRYYNPTAEDFGRDLTAATAQANFSVGQVAKDARPAPELF